MHLLDYSNSFMDSVKAGSLAYRSLLVELNGARMILLLVWFLSMESFAESSICSVKGSVSLRLNRSVSL